MNRRQLIAVVTTAALTGSVAKGATKESTPVVEACYACMKSGALCLAMCNDMLGKGMTALADCQKRVSDMLAMCEAVGTMVARNTAPAARLKAMAALCADTCRDCERACRPNASMAECKTCADDAAKCARACDAYGKA